MSAPMIAWEPMVSRIQKYFTGSDYTAKSVNLPPVKIHDVETAAEKRPRTLKHLIRANHVNHSIIYHNLMFHNHIPHILGSAYAFGADVDQMQEIYDGNSKEVEPWQASPAEVSDADWRNFLGDARYQRAYVDFFEDEMALKFNYDWTKVAEEYLFGGEHPLIHAMIGGIGHPLIHLAYAYEFSSKEVGMEALAMTCSAYNYLHKYLDDPSYTKPSTYSTSSPLEILHKIAEDKRFDGLFTDRGAHNIGPLFEDHENLVLEHWNAWQITNPTEQFRDSQEAAMALLVRTVKPGTHSYDFFIVHILTTSHAVRILLPLIPKKFHVSLIRQWWLLTIAIYVTQLRPAINDDIEVKPDKGWSHVEQMAIKGPWATDAHYVKALRAIKEAAFCWGDVHERYLASAVHFADDFKGWTGFE